MRLKKVIALLVLSFALLTGYAQDHLNVLTFNIRYNTPNDSANAWPNRKDLAAGQILFHEAHIVGVQEALVGQLQDLHDRLPTYKYVGVGRDDGKEKGEYSAIFYDTTRLKIIRSATFWLSQTPDKPGSKGWDAALPRVVTWAQFTDKKTKKMFYAFNTHFDHIGQVARKESALILMRKVKEIAGSSPVVITGDFNSKPTDEPTVLLKDKTNPLHFIDALDVSSTPHYGPNWTFNGFKIRDENPERIDYIFILNGVKVLQHATLSQVWNGRFSSDHFPVFARVAIK